MRRIAVWALSLLLVVAIAGWLTATQAVAGDQNAKAPALDAKLAAGDLAGALALARAEQDNVLRDQLLARVAAAQIESSALTAAVDTAALMQDDVARTTALRQVAKSRAAGQGGGAAVDFNSLINLITSTIAPDSWDDNGGEGAIESYRAGIIVDSEGVLKRIKREDNGDWLAQLKRDSAARPKAESAKRQSALRKISLTRLERAVSLRRALGKPVDREMLVLAGLQRIEYILLYPETGDLVIAGPAGDWTYDHEGRTISAQTGRPLVRLDDLITVWRHTAWRWAAPSTPSRPIWPPPSLFSMSRKKSPSSPAHPAAGWKKFAVVSANKMLKSLASTRTRTSPACWSRPTIT
jgi:hypothetical protein